ncbi:MAG: hypothetical protein K1000chlam3_00901 [Chlamydiae bacterium]|nr:hypothetical protein [Chlamydiota bacterium]
MILPVSQQPISKGIEQERIPVKNSFFLITAEKVSYITLVTLSLFTAITAVFLGTCALLGNLSSWYLFCSLGLVIISRKIWAKANEIVDLNDPDQLKKLKKHFSGKSMTEMLKKYPLQTIIDYNIVSFDLLRERCFINLSWCVNPLHRDPLSILRQNADALFAYKIITKDIQRALKNGNIEELNKLLPNDIPAWKKMISKL